MAKSAIAVAVAALLAFAGPASAARTLRASSELSTLAQQLVIVLDTVGVSYAVAPDVSPSPESTVSATAYDSPVLEGAASPDPATVFETNTGLIVESTTSNDSTLAATAYTTSPPAETVYTSLSDLIAQTGGSPDDSPVVVVEAVGESPEGYFVPDSPVTLFV